MRKTAVVTGASRGIGLAIARQLATSDYHVACIARNRNHTLTKIAQQIGAAAFPADLSIPESLPALAQSLLDTLGHVDALVHCAGTSCHGLFQSIPSETRQALYALNLTAPIELTRLLLPSMLQRHTGNIVCISSIWGEIGGSCEVDYSAAKGALLAFVKALAKEVGPSGIRVNAVSPGTILTDMTRPLGDAVLEELAENTALERLGTPEDVANAVCFLLSNQASYLTGQNISINGGFF